MVDKVETLKRNLNFKQAFSFVVGCIIGAGIFVTPSLIARHTPSLFVALMAWILAGGVALLGSLCYCEMVSVVKKTGGSYVFILDCYGQAAGFLVNWTNTMIFAPCDVCIMLITVGSYACAPFFNDHSSYEYHWASRGVGIGVMWCIALIGYRCKKIGRVSDCICYHTVCGSSLCCSTWYLFDRDF